MHDRAQEAIHKRFSRRILIAGAGMAAAGAAGGANRSAAASSTNAMDPRLETWLAKQEIAELRRLYARATDLIGMVTNESIAEGRAVYRRVFTPDAKIGAQGIDHATGPDAWADIVANALNVFVSTQHLIGTQLVEVASLPDANGHGGKASMTSYVQAWHATEDEVWLFIGTYKDQLTYTSAEGWQINEMLLEQISTDRRPLNP